MYVVHRDVRSYVCNFITTHFTCLHYIIHTLLASQSSINVWSLLNGCKVQTIPVSVNDHYQQSPVMCYTNNFSGAGPYTSALIINMGGSLKAFSLRNSYPEKKVCR